ncbi:hypothetical protein [Vibrio chagasii]|uniref:hypothetical protein n=1 Tax=Vibrio chagasii TaxID=170679 RepID=UPI003BB5B2B8
MENNETPFDIALISSIGIDNPRNIKAQVKTGVLQRCLERGLLCEEDKRTETKRYKWVCKVIDNDFSGLCLLRKENNKVVNLSDLKDLFCDCDDLCEELVIRIAKRVLDRKID